MIIVPEKSEAKVMEDLFDPLQLESRFQSGRSNYIFEPDAYLDETYPALSNKLRL